MSNSVGDHRSPHFIPKLTLYTSHTSPYAHRGHMALKILDLPFDEVIIDLAKPRDDWYLKEINSRGFVPTLKVAAADGKTIVIRESSIIVNFLFDLALTLPSPYPETATAIIPRPVTLEDCQRRARGALLNDMFEAKVIPMVYQFLGLEDYAQGEDEESVVEEYIQIFSSEVEPHLIDANPFFGNSPEVTFVEIMTGGFVLKLYKYLDYRLIPERIGKGISETCPKFDAWAKAVRQSQVVQAGILDAEGSVVSHDEKVSHNETLDNEHGMVG